jgi:serine protease Do
MKHRAWLVGLTLAGIVAAGGSGSTEAKDNSESGDRAFLGVLVGSSLRGEDGARVDGVVDDSAAERAKLEEGDVIVSFDGQPVEDWAELGQRLRSASPEDRVQIEVLRDGRRQTFDVTLGSRPADELFGHGMARPKLGVQIVGTTPELREHLGGERNRGALVGKVLPDTPAEKAGLKVGDLITTLDGESVEGPGDIMAFLRGKDGETVELEVVRDHRTVSLKVTLP